MKQRLDSSACWRSSFRRRCCCSTFRCWRCGTVDATLLGVPLFPAALFVVWAAADRGAGLASANASLTDGLTAMLSPPLVIGASFAYLLLLFAVASWGDRRAAQGRSVDRQRLGLRAVAGGVLHRLDLLRQRRPRRRRRACGSCRSTSGPTLAMVLALDGGAQDDPHRRSLPHHLDRRLRRQPLRQEPAAGRAGDADHRGRHRALHRAAAEGGRHRLCAADHAARAARPRRAAALVARQHACTSRCCWPASRSCSARATWTAPSATRAWWRRSRSNRWSSCWPSWPSASSSPGACSTAWPTCSRARDAVPELQGAADAWARAAGLRLRAVVRADAAVDAVGDVPAAAVPGDGGRERRRAPPASARSGSFRCTCWRSTCSCCRSRWAGCCTSAPAARNADTFVLSLPLAPGAADAGAGGLHRRAVGGHRHGHRRDHRGVDHGLQRPGDAAAAAHAALRRRAGAAT